MAFAYREKGHSAAIARVRRTQRDLMERYSTGSFEPYRYEGTWKGRNILDPARSAGTDPPPAGDAMTQAGRRLP